MKSRKDCDFVWISAKNLMTVLNVDAESARLWIETLPSTMGYKQFLKVAL